MDDATVSIAIPVYNGGHYLQEAIASVQSQTRQPDEVLVFDNCSTDGSRDVAGAAIGAENVVPSASNLGAVANFNRAVEGSAGTYFAWLGADDRFAPRFVEQALAQLRAHPGAPACLTAVQFIDPDGSPLGVQRDPDLASTSARIRLRSYLRRPRWTEVYCLYRRDVLLTSPMFQDEYGADVLLIWWFLLRHPLVVSDEPLVEYRTYPVKSADTTAESLNPAVKRRRWLMTGLWRSLWREAGAPDVAPAVRRTARSELLRCLVRRHWLKHVAWDFYLVGGDLVRRGRRVRGART